MQKLHQITIYSYDIFKSFSWCQWLASANKPTHSLTTCFAPISNQFLRFSKTSLRRICWDLYSNCFCINILIVYVRESFNICAQTCVFMSQVTPRRLSCVANKRQLPIEFMWNMSFELLMNDERWLQRCVRSLARTLPRSYAPAFTLSIICIRMNICAHTHTHFVGLCTCVRVCLQVCMCV